MRNRTKIKGIAYAFLLPFDGIYLRNTSKALSRFVKKSHIAIKDWIQKYTTTKKLPYSKEDWWIHIIDEILIKVGSYEYIWLWFIIEPKYKESLSITISKETSMLVASSRFYQKLYKNTNPIRFQHHTEEAIGIYHKYIDFWN